MADLKPVLESTVSSTLKIIGGGKHLLQHLQGANVQRNALLSGAECMWSFTKDATQNILTNLERIEMLGYGIDERTGTTTADLDPLLDDLLRTQATRPDKIATDISDEVVLLKTSHGLPVSALRPITEMQHAYQIMNVVRGAPYLHIDYAEQVRAAYAPLANIERTHKEVVNAWKDEADSIDQSDPLLADELRNALRTYEAARVREAIYIDALVDVKDETNLFFDFVDDLREVFQNLSLTSAVTQALMKFVELEEILHTQGWVKIAPAPHEHFDPNQHLALNKIPVPGILPDRVIDVKCPGYKRQLPGGKPQIRLAVVDASA